MNIFDLHIDELDSTRPVVNNLYPHFTEETGEMLDLRGLAIQVNEPQSSRGMGSKIVTGFKFVTTTGLVFVGLFVMLNWGAYSQIFQHWYRSINPNAEKTKEQLMLASVLDTDSVRADEIISTEINQGDTIDYESYEVAPPNDYLVIPKIGITIPIIYPSADNLLKEDWKALEKDIMQSLKHGASHYPGTAVPGERGNTVITAHSSYYPNGDKYNDAGALFHTLKVGDETALWHDGVRYVYRLKDIKIVKPEDVSVLAQNPDTSLLTLITCDPPGTTYNRWVGVYEQIFPNPKFNQEMEGGMIIGGVLHA